MIPSTFTRTFILFTGMSVALVGLYFSCLWGTASIANYLAQNNLQMWVNGESVPNREKWLKIQETMTFALDMEPNNADFQSDMGNLYLYKANYLAIDTVQIDLLMQESLKHFRKAALLRPAWPDAWANIVFIKSKKNILDQEFYHAFDRSVMLGSAVPRIQYLLSVAAFSHWEMLPDSYKKKAMSNAYNALSSRRKSDVLVSLRHYDLLSLICERPSVPIIVKPYCNNNS
ncbi:MAG: hypothetical protein JKY87_06940 [Mariprofundus sp.]|nr:hypothetical protein [Mariprofundus sp.]